MKHDRNMPAPILALIPAPVLALTLVDGGSLSPAGKVTIDSRVLLAVRDPETNETHPGVVSVPTQRIPQGSFQQLPLPRFTKTRAIHPRYFLKAIRPTTLS
jgi:hypothetical protein